MTQGSDLKYSEGFQELQVLSNLAASTELPFISFSRKKLRFSQYTYYPSNTTVALLQLFLKIKSV